MIDRKHPRLSVVAQCRLLALPRSSFYYRPEPIPDADLKLMKRIDELHLEYPFAGSRMLRLFLRKEGFLVGRRRVVRLMRKVGIEALYCKPRTTYKDGGHTVYPYLLRDLPVTHSNQVWAADITYIPMAKGFVYLFAVIDWFSRRALAWRLSNTLTTDFCLDAVNDALANHGTPEIFNTDQGCQFTSKEFTGLLRGNGIRISMDGKGCWRDNVFVERLWRTIKYEEVFLKAYDSVGHAKSSLKSYLAFYNTRRPHQRLDGKTPDEVYFANLPQLPMAA